MAHACSVRDLPLLLLCDCLRLRLSVPVSVPVCVPLPRPCCSRDAVCAALRQGLIAFRHELLAGQVDVQPDPSDLECAPPPAPRSVCAPLP